MKNRIIACLMTAFICGCFHHSLAQDFAPKAGDKQVSLRLGRAVDYGTLTSYEVNNGVNSYSSNTTYMDQAVDVNYFNNNSNSIVNAIGVEFKYFLTSNIALRFDGSGMITSSPAQDYVSGVYEEASIPGTYIPNYAYVDGKTTKQFYVDLGGDYYFTTKVPRLFPYAGVQANLVYAQMTIFDGYRGLDSDGEVISTYDDRTGEAYAFGGSVVGGVDYYLADGFFLGLEIKAFQYMYNGKRIFHQQGMEAQESVSHVTSFLSQPVLKIGFKF